LDCLAHLPVLHYPAAFHLLALLGPPVLVLGLLVLVHRPPLVQEQVFSVLVLSVVSFVAGLLMIEDVVLLFEKVLKLKRL
jgi:hypothetical protein